MPGVERTLAERLRLIVVTDPELVGARPLLDVVAEALDAGAPAVQLRDKRAGSGDLLDTARGLRRVTRDAGALFIVNDRLDVALAADADGVHVGPDDLPVQAIRRCVPEGFLVGASTDEPDRARALEAEGADYLGCGTVYATTTKPDAGAAIGVGGVDVVARAVSIPVVAIGGITPERVSEVAETNAAGVAVVGAVMTSDDVAATVRALLGPWADRR